MIRVWFLRVLLAGVIWLVAVGAMWLIGDEPRWDVIGVIVAAGSLVIFLVLDVTADLEPVRWPDPVPPPVRQPGEDQRLVRIHRVLDQHLDGREVGDALHRRLSELADHRLMETRGVSLRADPARATALMGPDLAAVVTAGPPYPRLSLDQIDRIITRIEEL